MSGTFELDPRLAADTHPVLDLPLCRVLLMNDSRWPWLILVPRRAGLRELLELDAVERQQLFDELDQMAQWVQAQPLVQKLNVAALGNVVAQLHVHLIGRHSADAAWPRPVWGTAGSVPYSAEALAGVQGYFGGR